MAATTTPDAAIGAAVASSPGPPPRRGAAVLWRRAQLSALSLWSALVVVLGVLLLWPLWQLLTRAFADGGAGFADLADLPRIGTTIGNTVLLGVGSTVVALTLGTFLAWSATRLPRRGRRVMELIPLIPLVIPAVAALIGWSFLLSPSVGYINIGLRKTPLFDHLVQGPIDVYTVPWIVFFTGVNLTSFVYLFVHTSLKNMGDEHEAAALVSGASRTRAFFTVTLPLLRPALAYASGVVLLLGLGQFTAPLLLGRPTGIAVLTTEMFRLTDRTPVNYGLGAALGFPLVVAGLVIVVLQRLVVGNQRRFVVVGARAHHQVVEPRWWSSVVLGTYGMVAVVLPLLALLHVGLSPFWTGQFQFDHLTLQHVRDTVGDDATRQAIWNSVRISVLAVAVVLPLGLLIAWGLMGNSGIRRAQQAALDVMAQVPLAVPSSLMGFALLFTYSREPLVLYGTTAVMVLTYVTLMVPHATRLQLSTLIGLGTDFWDASRVSGAGPLRTLLQVIVPMARRGIAASAAIMVVLLTHEFSASLMVRSVRTQVMGSLLYDRFTGGIYPQVAVVALLMVVVTTAGVVLALSIGGSDSLERM